MSALRLNITGIQHAKKEPSGSFFLPDALRDHVPAIPATARSSIYYN